MPKNKKSNSKSRAKGTAKKKSSAKKGSAKKSVKKAKSFQKKSARSSSKRDSMKSKSSQLLKKAKNVAIESLKVLNEEDSTASLVMKRIREALSPTHFSLKNFSEAHKKHPEFKKSGGGHYAVHVVSEVFEGLDLKSRQQWILNLLKDQIGKTVHAIQMELRAPSEVPLLKDSGAPLRRDLKVRLDRPNLPRKTSQSENSMPESDEIEGDE